MSHKKVKLTCSTLKFKESLEQKITIMRTLFLFATVIALLALSSFSFDQLPGDLTFTSSYSELIEVDEVIIMKKVHSDEGEVRNLPEFSSISLSISANIYLTQGPKQEVRIEAKSDDLEEIETKVKNGQLHIKTDSWTSNIGNVNIYITMKELDGIEVAGSGNIYGKGSFVTDHIELEVAGSGNMEFKDIKANKMIIAIAGSGDVFVAGNSIAKSHVVKIAGSGDVNAKGFEADDVKVNIAGSGDCYVNARKSLEVNIAGSGDVYYRGDPRVEENVVGSGDVERI